MADLLVLHCREVQIWRVLQGPHLWIFLAKFEGKTEKRAHKKTKTIIIYLDDVRSVDQPLDKRLVFISFLMFFYPENIC